MSSTLWNITLRKVAEPRPEATMASAANFISSGVLRNGRNQTDFGDRPNVGSHRLSHGLRSWNRLKTNLGQCTIVRATMLTGTSQIGNEPSRRQSRWLGRYGSHGAPH